MEKETDQGNEMVKVFSLKKSRNVLAGDSGSEFEGFR